MIKFFRKIRQNLLMENNTGKYFKYAIGEIFLVMIGILLALQVNNWNENRNEEVRKNAFLVELKKNIELDIAYLVRNDSILGDHKTKSEKALSKFYRAKNLQDLLFVDSLYTFQWSDLRLSRSVYDEMLNTGSIYIIKNEGLKKQINEYYSLIESRQYIIKKINDISIDLSDNKAMSQMNFLRDTNDVFINEIQMNWVGDPNSEEYLDLYNFYRFTFWNSINYRRNFYQGILKEGKDLLRNIELEIDNNK